MALSAKSNDGFMAKMNEYAKAATNDLHKMQDDTAKAKENLEAGEKASEGIRDNTRQAADNTKTVQNQVKAAVTEAMKLKAAFDSLATMSMKFMRGFEKVNGTDWRKTIKSVDELEKKLIALGKNDSVFEYLDEDDAAKAIEKIRASIAKLEAKQQKAAEKSNQSTKKQAENQKELNSQLDKTAKALEKITEVYKKLNQAIAAGGFMKVKVENSGFQSIVSELAKAVELNKKRKNTGNLFLDAFTKNAKESAGEVKETTNEIGDLIGSAFDSDSVKDKITKGVSKAIKDGIIAGLRRGTADGLSNLDATVVSDNIAELMAKLDEKNVRRASVNYITDKIFDGAPMSDKQKTSVQKAKAKYEAQAKYQSKVDIKNIEEVEATKRQAQEHTHQMEMERIRAERVERERNRVLEANPEQATRIAKSLADIESGKASLTRKLNKDDAEYSAERLKQMKLATELMMVELEQDKENLKKTRNWNSRKEAVLDDWFKTEAELEAEIMRNGGKQASPVDQAIQHMDELIAKRHDLEMQARDGVRNTSQQVKNFHDMVKQTKLIAEEQYKVNKGYYEQESSLKKALEHYQKMDRYLQAIGNTISGATRAWNQFGGMIQNIFGRFRNGIMNLFSSGRSQLRQLVSDATDQYSKLERAQIGFTNFFGSESAQKLVTRIQQEAIAAPSLSSGDLADYVAQLAPVSNGNADLALNATMGILKAIQYSGSDASTEMSRVVANIRDVMSKGMANTIDIRQFNRAMPAIEKALSELGASEFLKDGQLSITKDNAKTLMEAFAKLNTDPASPVKNIFKQMGNTIEALQEAWKERRTQMVMNVLKDSGAFDMLKGLLTEASNNGLLYKVQDFFTKKIKAIIDWIKSVDWDRVGSMVSDGFAKIRDAVKSAYETVSGVIPDMDGWKILETAFNAIKSAIEGFAQGVKTTIQTLNNIFGGITPEVIEKAASVVGFMLSPVQKLFSTIGSLATSVLSFAQNTNKTLGQFSQSRIRKYEESVKAAAELQARIATNGMWSANDMKALKNMTYDPVSNLYTRTLADNTTQRGYLYGGTFIKESMYNEMKQLGFLKTAVKDQIAKDTYGLPLENLDFLQRQRVNLQYTGGKVSNWWQKTLNSFTNQLGKLVNGGQLLAFGTSITAMTDKTNTLVQVLGQLVSALGIFTAGRGIGGMVGGLLGSEKMGTMVGGILGAVTGILTVVNAWWESEKAKREEEALQKREAAANEHVDNIRRKVMEALGLDETKTESAAYVFDEVTKRLNKENINDIAGNGQYGDMAGVLKEFTQFGQAELNRYYRSDMLEAIDDFKEKDEKEMTDEAKAFHAATGKLYSNWGDDASAEEQAVRKFLADMVREHGLLSDAQVGGLLSNATDQKIVETFLQDFDGTINEGQVKILKDKLAEANATFPSDMEVIATKLKDNTDIQTKLNQSIKDLDTTAQKLIKADEETAQNETELKKESEYTDSALAESRSGLSDGLLDGAQGIWAKFRIGLGEAMASVFGDEHSLGFKYFKNDLKLWDDMTEEVTRVQNGTIGGYTPTPNTIAGNTWNQIKDLPAIKGIENTNTSLFDFIDQQLRAVAFHAQANGDENMLNVAGQIYRFIEQQGSYVNLSAEETQKKMMDLIMYIKALIPNFFNANLYNMKTPLNTPTGLGGLGMSIIKGHAAGGTILGRGVDTVPAFLQPGEFVMRRGSVAKAGLGVMAALNRGDLAAAARGLGSRLITGGSFNNSKNWSNITNNNQRTNNNVFNIVNRNMSARMNTYHSLANRIATA